MEQDLLVGLGSILVLGISAGWIAWRLHLPSILLLLLVGLVAGPISGFLHPDELLGDLLFPVVSLSVAVILFEGGLSLNLRALKENGVTIWNMILVGALVTWVVAAIGAYFLLGFDLGLSLLIGAILIVTGPTVIIPMLLYIRPRGRVGPIAKWEGIVNDPIGAIIAVLVFETLMIGLGQGAARSAILGLINALLFGSLCGAGGALLIVVLLKRFWLPDLLQEPVTLMVCIGAFMASNGLQEESGLLAVTIMGVVLANQRWVSVQHIIEFKERLRVLLISGLFVLLAARLKMSDLAQIDLGSVLFLLLLIVVARPLAVALSTVGSGLDRSERTFLAWMAPRGIVAAAVSSVFALRLAEHGYPGAERLMPEVFFVIIGTVVIYGLSSAPLARRLGLADSTPQGLLIVSGHAWAREIGLVVKRQGFDVMLVDTNWSNVSAARMAGLDAYHANIVSGQVDDFIALHSIGRLLALTPNDEANSLAALRFAEVLGRSSVYQLAPKGAAKLKRSAAQLTHLRGRLLFGLSHNFEQISQLCASGGQIKSVNLTKKFDYRSFKELYGDQAIPLFLITEDKKLLPFSVDQELRPEPGQKLIAMVREPENSGKIKTTACS
ncbi:MAG: sodium:proton antiporter [Candidatus Alcyoniella australis]|nr:sodium:proton antiporter [Candidatus Alcyoniella australis]